MAGAGRALARRGGWPPCAAIALALATTSVAAHAGPGSHEITLTPGQLPRAIHGLDYAAQISASGGLAPYAFTLDGGALPDGTALSAAGVLDGVPTVPGAAAFTVSATDDDGCTASASFLVPVARGFRAPDDQVDLSVPAAGSGGSGDPQLDKTLSTLEVEGIQENGVAVLATAVYVTLLHGRTGDLLLTLVAPDGTRTRLSTLRGGTGQDFLGTCFRASADSAICDGAAPFGGEYRPEGPLHLLRPNGTWTLEIEDTVAGATGVLLDWSLALETAVAGQSTVHKFAWDWTFPTPMDIAHIAVNETDFFISSDQGTVRRYPKAFPHPYTWERTLGPEPARSLFVDRVNRVPLVAVASESGFAYGLDAADGVILWSRSLRRPTCSADGLGVPPFVQLWEQSDCAFRATTPDDLIYFGTDFGCSTTTANRVIALHSTSGNIRWTFNAAGTLQMDRVTGMVGDPTRNRLFVVSAKSDPFATQSTVWALNTVTGTKIWSDPLGDIAVPPALADGLFVLSRSGELAKLDPDTGAVRWSFTLAGGTKTFENVLAHDPNAKLLFAVDSDGDLHAVSDLDDSAALLWTWAPSETLCNVVVLPHREFVVVSSTLGRFHQVDKQSGTPLMFGQVGGTFGPYFGTSPKLMLDDHGGGRVESRLTIWGAPNRLTRAFTPWHQSNDNSETDWDYFTPPGVELLLEGNASPAAVSLGGLVTDELELSNQLSFIANGGHGVCEAERVDLETTLPAGTSLAGVEIDQGTYSLDGQQLTIRLGTLQLAQETSVRVTLVPSRSGIFERNYSVSADLPDNHPGNNTVTLETRVLKARRFTNVR